MTPGQHNRYLGLSHLAFAVTHQLMILGSAVLIFLMFRSILQSPNGPGFWVPIAFAGLILGFNSVFIVPSFFAAFGLLKRRRWAKSAAIPAGVLAAMFFPMGTAVCVYTFWFLLSDKSKALYDSQPAPQLPEGAGFRAEPSMSPTMEPVPRHSPPDWR
jgi:hypothetical protein